MATGHSGGMLTSEESTSTDSGNEDPPLLIDTTTSDMNEREKMRSSIMGKLFGGVPYEKLSKNAQKKILSVRLKRSKRKKEKKLSRTEDVKTSDDDHDDQKVLSKRTPKEQQRERLREALQSGLRVAVDCSMGDQMLPKEICKLGRQIRFIYSSLLESEKPFHLYLTGLVKDSNINKELHRQCDGIDNYIIDMTESLHYEVFSLDQLVYLTPDSPNTLDTLHNDKVYVLGGLVDESLEVGYTFKNAEKLKLNTARLPIDVYMEKTNPCSHCCLPINQVMDILLDVHSGMDWGTVLQRYIVARKGYILKPFYKT